MEECSAGYDRTRRRSGQRHQASLVKENTDHTPISWILCTRRMSQWFLKKTTKWKWGQKGNIYLVTAPREGLLDGVTLRIWSVWPAGSTQFLLPNKCRHWWPGRLKYKPENPNDLLLRGSWKKKSCGCFSLASQATENKLNFKDSRRSNAQ